MKFLVLSLFAALAAATPITVRAPANAIAVRDDDSSTTRTDLDDGSASACPEVILIFARGTTEAGNMGPIAGVPLAEDLGTYYGDSNLWVQGVGGPYTAGLIENLEPGGTSQAAIGEGVRLFEEANTKCPNSAVVAGGYSQGAALMAGAIPKLSDAARNQIKGVVLFGYTQDKQNNGGVPSLPQSELLVICAPGDLVCDGTLIITPSHLVYGLYAPEAATFLEGLAPKSS